MASWIMASFLVSTARAQPQQVGFVQADVAAYVAAFPQLEAAATDAVRPPALTAACEAQPTVAQPMATVTLVGTASPLGAVDVQTQCSASVACLVPANVSVLMDASVNVGALIVYGHLQWDDSVQTQPDQWLCAGYVAVEAGGTFNLTMSASDVRAWVFIKANGASHPALGPRGFGGVGMATVELNGPPMARTWSLLAAPAAASALTLTTVHDPRAMGWRVGDRIMLAPTTRGSSGSADAATITVLGSNNITLSAPLTSSYQARFTAMGDAVVGVSEAAEVIHLTRTVILTGDPLSTGACPAGLARAYPAGPDVCTMGLHAILMGRGGSMRVRHARVERCGQRGVVGKYCLHFHLVGRCPSCAFEGNAIEHGHQRGIVIHGTHESHVSANVIADVRGAGIYIEDGNEMWNRVTYNMVICPWSREGPMRGCTAPGTDNDQADTALNQAGLWALSATNHFVGNRFANSFNGLFIQSNFAPSGRGAAQGACCTEYEGLGRVRGNTNHGHGRFGWYLLGPNFPRRVEMSVATNGHANLSTCGAFGEGGLDRGSGYRLSENVDYDNVFVGQYDAGDVQYAHHASVHNLNAIYWKTTKNFADGCSSHLLGGLVSGGTVALPDQAAVIMERVTFEGDALLESNHHCNVGVTGALCSPTYILDHVTWRPSSSVWFSFHAEANNNGGVFALAPGTPHSHGVFPPGYVALCSASYMYLLDYDGGGGSGNATCVTAVSLGVGARYAAGILCRAPW